MRMDRLIEQKRDGHALTESEIRFFIDGYTAGQIPDYQVAALLMAIYFQGMNRAENGESDAGDGGIGRYA